MPTDRTTPKLRPEILADDIVLAGAIDQLLHHNTKHGRQTKRILNAQSALRRVVSRQEWQVYLSLEAVTNARFADVVAVVVPWAFAQSRKHPRPRRR